MAKERGDGLALVEKIVKCRISDDIDPKVLKRIIGEMAPYVEKPMAPSGDMPYKTNKILELFPLMEIAKYCCVEIGGVLARMPVTYQGYNHDAKEIYLYNDSMSVRVDVPFFDTERSMRLENVRKKHITISGIEMTSSGIRIRTLTIHKLVGLILHHEDMELSAKAVREAMLEIFDAQTHMYKFLNEPFNERFKRGDWYDTWFSPEEMSMCVDHLVMEYYNMMIKLMDYFRIKKREKEIKSPSSP